MNKGPDAYRTIGEASKEVGVEPYVLRFWEPNFLNSVQLRDRGVGDFIDLLILIS